MWLVWGKPFLRFLTCKIDWTNLLGLRFPPALWFICLTHAHISISRSLERACLSVRHAHVHTLILLYLWILIQMPRWATLEPEATEERKIINTGLLFKMLIPCSSWIFLTLIWICKTFILITEFWSPLKRYTQGKWLACLALVPPLLVLLYIWVSCLMGKQETTRDPRYKVPQRRPYGDCIISDPPLISSCLLFCFLQPKNWVWGPSGRVCCCCCFYPSLHRHMPSAEINPERSEWRSRTRTESRFHTHLSLDLSRDDYLSFKKFLS